MSMIAFSEYLGSFLVIELINLAQCGMEFELLAFSQIHSAEAVYTHT